MDVPLLAPPRVAAPYAPVVLPDTELSEWVRTALLICGGRFMALCAFAALTTSNPEPRSIARKFLAIALESASLGHLSERRLCICRS